ncbi:MAG: class I SAM-dependent methyltransferase [Chloroflexi bacterium]|nr:class I SAM-dependent methyltransferase [Chloroflexota bacterium]
MTTEEMVALIRDGVPVRGGVWADFGAGTGNFTQALQACLGDDAVLYAVDRDERALRQLRRRWTGPNTLHTLTADFTQPLTGLPALEGALMANALHFTPFTVQSAVLAQVVSYLKPGTPLIVVEYDVRQRRSYIPHPVSYGRFEDLARAIGLQDPRRIGLRRSPRTGQSMYAACALRPSG